MTKTLSEASGTVYLGKNIKHQIDESLLLENLSKKRKEEQDQKEVSELLIEAEKTKQEELEKKLETLEMLPISNKVILLPYPQNPYLKTVSKGGLFIPTEMKHINAETGEIEKDAPGIQCAKVIEVGPDCKSVLPGDDVFYESRATAPIPFFSLGYVITSEPNIFAFLNEGLKARQNKV